jgi:hypothetical protein
MTLVAVEWERLHEELCYFSDFFGHFDSHDIVAELYLRDRVRCGKRGQRSIVHVD